LCTLLLQQGHRVEYAAASDSFTKAPEDFKEFFNQRRRWIPSTMANIADLVFSWRRTTAVNESLSWVYMLYQFVMLLASILGPGIIFLMMIGALRLALENVFNIAFWGSAVLNLVPVAIFVILCFYTKSEVQVCADVIFKKLNFNFNKESKCTLTFE
jgi:chitin synthase